MTPTQFAILKTEEERCKGAPLAAFRLSQKGTTRETTKISGEPQVVSNLYFAGNPPEFNILRR
jgi:hypothetical protein